MRRSASAAWAVFALSLAAMLAALIVWAVATGEPLTPDIVLYPAAYVAFGAVGALIVSRHATHRIGRLALATGALGSFVALCDSVARSVQPIPGQEWARYDHKLLLEGFGTRLRDEVELDIVGRSLVGVADHAVRPASITLWLRGGSRSSADEAA